MKTFLFSWTKYGIAGNVKTSREYINEMKRQKNTVGDVTEFFKEETFFRDGLLHNTRLAHATVIGQ